MVDTAPHEQGVIEIQARLQAAANRWMPVGGQGNVALPELAALVHDIAHEQASRVVAGQIADRYQELARSMRRSSAIAGMPLQAVTVLDQWAYSIERRAQVLREYGQPALTGGPAPAERTEHTETKDADV